MDQILIEEIKHQALALRNTADCVLNLLSKWEKENLNPKKKKTSDIKASIVSRVIANQNKKKQK